MCSCFYIANIICTYLVLVLPGIVCFGSRDVTRTFLSRGNMNRVSRSIVVIGTYVVFYFLTCCIGIWFSLVLVCIGIDT